jgi:hypothetical protein
MSKTSEKIQELEVQLTEMQVNLKDIIAQGKETKDAEEKQALLENLDNQLLTLDETRQSLRELYVERHLQAAGVETKKGWKFPRFW